MTGTIYLIRHGQSIVNVDRRISCKRRDGDLTTLGYNQAHRAGLWFKDRQIGRVIVSPFERALQTGRIIADVLDVPISREDGLAEVDCGDIDWRTDDDAWNQWENVYQRWLQGEATATYPGGESFQNAYARFAQALSAAPDDNCVMVSHAGIIRSVTPYLCVNAAALQRVEMPSHTGMIVLTRYDHGRYVCHAWDDRSHLN